MGEGFKPSCDDDDGCGKGLLHRRFPMAFETGSKEIMHPTPEGLPKFLRSLGLGGNARDIIIELLQLTDFKDSLTS